MPITLTSPVVVTEGSQTLETDAAAACMDLTADFFGEQCVVVFKNGTLSGSGASQVLTPGALAPNPVVVTFNLVTGAWSTNTGLSGTLTGASFTAMLTQIASIRSGLESFATSENIIPGTAVAWAG